MNDKGKGSWSSDACVGVGDEASLVDESGGLIRKVIVSGDIGVNKPDGDKGAQ